MRRCMMSRWVPFCFKKTRCSFRLNLVYDVMDSVWRPVDQRILKWDGNILNTNYHCLALPSVYIVWTCPPWEQLHWCTRPEMISQLHNWKIFGWWLARQVSLQTWEGGHRMLGRRKAFQRFCVCVAGPTGWGWRHSCWWHGHLQPGSTPHWWHGALRQCWGPRHALRRGSHARRWVPLSMPNFGLMSVVCPHLRCQRVRPPPWSLNFHFSLTNCGIRCPPPPQSPPCLQFCWGRLPDSRNRGFWHMAAKSCFIWAGEAIWSADPGWQLWCHNTQPRNDVWWGGGLLRNNCCRSFERFWGFVSLSVCQCFHITWGTCLQVRCTDPWLVLARWRDRPRRLRSRRRRKRRPAVPSGDCSTTGASSMLLPPSVADVDPMLIHKHHDCTLSR